MPKKYTITYQPVQSPITEPVTKFGGQPVWLEDPCWPLSCEYGTPMQFICQIVLTADLFGDIESRMAYLFMTDWDGEGPFPDTFDPQAGENAVILQPGGIWEGPSQSLREGPSLYQRSSENHEWKYTPVELAIDLKLGDDAEEGAWDNVDSEDRAAWDWYFHALLEDKIGGTPVPTTNFNPREDFAAGEWLLLLQLDTKVNQDEDPFMINFAPDGTGYAFISEDGRRAKFMWSR